MFNSGLLFLLTLAISIIFRAYPVNENGDKSIEKSQENLPVKLEKTNKSAHKDKWVSNQSDDNDSSGSDLNNPKGNNDFRATIEVAVKQTDQDRAIKKKQEQAERFLGSLASRLDESRWNGGPNSNLAQTGAPVILSNKELMRLNEQSEVFDRREKQNNEPFISSNQSVQAASKYVVLKRSKNQQELQKKSKQYDAFCQSHKDAPKTTDNSGILTLCGKPVSVKEGYSPEMVKALYELEGMNPPVVADERKVTPQPVIQQEQATNVHKTKTFKTFKPHLNQKEFKAFTRQSFQQGAVCVIARNEQNKQSTYKHAFPPSVIAAITKAINNIEPAQNIEHNQDIKVLLEVISNVETANKQCEVFEQTDLGNLQFLDNMQDRIFRDIGLTSDLSSMFFCPIKAGNAFYGKQFERSSCSEIGLQLNDLEQKFDLYKKEADRNKPSGDYWLINAPKDKIVHTARSLALPETRNISESVHLDKFLQRYNITKSFNNSYGGSYLQTNVKPINNSNFSSIRQVLMGRDAEYFIFREIDKLREDTAIINRTHRDYFELCHGNLHKGTTGQFPKRFTTFTQDVLQKLNTEQKRALYTNLTMAADAQNETIKAIEQNLSDLNNQLYRLNTSTGDMAQDLTNVYYQALLEKCIAVAEMQYSQALEYSAFYEESQKLTLYAIKDEQRKTAQFFKKIFFVYEIASSVISNAKEEGRRRQDAVADFYEHQDFSQNKIYEQFRSNRKTADFLIEAISHVESKSVDTSYSKSLLDGNLKDQILKPHIENFKNTLEKIRTDIKQHPELTHNQDIIPENVGTLLQAGNIREALKQDYLSKCADLSAFIQGKNDIKLDSFDAKTGEFALKLRSDFMQAQERGDIQTQENISKFLAKNSDFFKGIFDEVTSNGIEIFKGLPSRLATNAAVDLAVGALSGYCPPAAVAIEATKILVNTYDISTTGKRIVDDVIDLVTAFKEGNGYEAGRHAVHLGIDGVHGKRSLRNFSEGLSNINNNYFKSNDAGIKNSFVKGSDKKPILEHKNQTTPWNIVENNTGRVQYSFNGKLVNLYRDPTEKYWWSKDVTGHGGSFFKVFVKDGNGFRWVADADQYGNFIENKHKGPTGLFIKPK